MVTAALVLDLLIWGQDGRTRLGFTVPAGVVVATAVCAFPVLLLRRRRPWVAFATMWAYTVVWGSLLPTYQPFTGLPRDTAAHLCGSGERDLIHSGVFSPR